MANFTAYTDLATVKAYGFVTGVLNDNLDDAQIGRAILAAQNMIDTHCRWSFQDETRTAEEIATPFVKVDGDGNLVIRTDKCPITSVTSIEYRARPDQSWVSVSNASIEYYPLPATVSKPTPNANLIVCYGSYFSLRGQRIRVRVTYTGGFTSTTPPAMLNLLATRMAWWKFKQKDAPFEKTANPAMGVVIIPSALPGDIRADLELWQRWA